MFPDVHDDSLTVHIEAAHPDFDYNGYLVKVSKDKERGLDKKNRFEDEKLFKEDGWRSKKNVKNHSTQKKFTNITCESTMEISNVPSAKKKLEISLVLIFISNCAKKEKKI